MLLVHIGGRNPDSKLVGIHGRHLGLVTYIAADAKRQEIPWVSYRNYRRHGDRILSTDNPPKPELVAHG